ncbi:MAG: 1-deoxy-D-xylulose-5-phosphate reductoisomerase [Dethiosulfovibrio peptidovorans]|nr:MAG: 1-deoxy-D-xylulose-5-phosphate reductoisomerase [Dethiosulfovibrio peptidovorans]
MEVCRRYPDEFSVIALAANSDMKKMGPLVQEFRPALAAMAGLSGKTSLPRGRTTRWSFGPQSLMEVVDHPDVSHVVVASSGTDGIPALQAALIAGKDVSLANKESVVVAGPWVLPEAAPGQIRPLDSEHNAIWQCLLGEDIAAVDHVAVTASGGPFRETPLEELALVTPEMAVAHPVWSMGDKISVDSATMINKGIEIVEAMRLFDLPHDRVRGYIHPGSSIHGLVRFIDGTVKLLMAPPDMKLAALSALGYPKRVPLAPLGISPLDLDGADLSFRSPDRNRYPGYYLCLEVAKAGGSYPTVLVGADEVAVLAFLRGVIPFTHIWRTVASVLERFDGRRASSLEDELSILDWARREARSICVLEE